MARSAFGHMPVYNLLPKRSWRPLIRFDNMGDSTCFRDLTWNMLRSARIFPLQGPLEFVIHA